MSGGVCGILGRNMGRGGGSRRRRSLSRSLPFLRQDFPEYAATRQCDADQPKDNDTPWRRAALRASRLVAWGSGEGGWMYTHLEGRNMLTETPAPRAILVNTVHRV